MGDDLYEILPPALTASVKRLSKAVDDVSDAVDELEQLGYSVRLFIVPDADDRPTLGINVDSRTAEGGCIWLSEIEH